MRTSQPSLSGPVTAGISLGTLWTLERGESSARCVLIKLPDCLELRVLMDESPLRTERRDSHRASLELADRWRQRMMERGWARAPRLSHCEQSEADGDRGK